MSFVVLVYVVVLGGMVGVKVEVFFDWGFLVVDVVGFVVGGNVVGVEGLGGLDVVVVFLFVVVVVGVEFVVVGVGV